jgi:hypothetical protein
VDVFATQVPLGIYKIVVPDTAVTPTKLNRHERLFDLVQGDLVEITETSWLEEGGRIRGKYFSAKEGRNLWITISKTSNKKTFARPAYAKNVYRVVKETGVTKSKRNRKKVLYNLAVGTYVNIVETPCLLPEDGNRVRGKMCNGHWITLAVNDSGKGKKTLHYAKTLPLGEYKITQSAGVSKSKDELSSISYTLDVGRIVKIVETVWLEDGGRVRGRLSNGDWITICVTERSKTYAEPVDSSKAGKLLYRSLSPGMLDLPLLHSEL